jgi:3-phosphoshikimate 1-carboxyvinyltransferase
MSRFVVRPSASLSGEFAVPGDKSISHRALLLGAIAEGTTEIRGFLEGEDCLATLAAIRALGVRVERPAAGSVLVHGVGLRGLTAPPAPLDMGNAGTAMRLFMGLLSAQRFDSALSGDASLMRRPMERAAVPLRQMGAGIETTEGRPPVRISGNRSLQGIRYSLPVASAQVKSAILLAGLFAAGTTTVEEPAVTRDHTERMLQAFGCEVSSRNGTAVLSPPAKLQSTQIVVPGDFSSAAFFIVAACIAAREPILLRGVGVNPTRTGLLEMLALMGADLRLYNHRSQGREPVADIEIRPARLRGARIPERLVPLAIDELPALFIAAACADGETVVTGAAELRVKESDRIAAMSRGLGALGVRHEALPDGMRITGQAAFAAGTVDSVGDHRIAMAFAMAGLRVHGEIEILDVANVATSFPGFAQLARLGGLDLTETA